VAEEKFRSLSDVLADDARRLVVSKMESREQFEELSLILAWGAELSHHSWPVTGGESHVSKDVGRCPPSC
jgi:hypothetical protein